MIGGKSEHYKGFFYKNIMEAIVEKGRKIGFEGKKYEIKGRIRSCRFLLIFKVAILVFQAPAGSSNPAGHSLTLE